MTKADARELPVGRPLPTRSGRSKLRYTRASVGEWNEFKTAVSSLR
jgi:hypothetical protein